MTTKYGHYGETTIITGTELSATPLFLIGVTLGRKLRRRMVKPEKKKEKGHATMTYATTTPLVTNVFNNYFQVGTSCSIFS